MSAKLIPVTQIEGRILLIRGQKIILDRDLAVLYGVETRVLNQAVRRNIERFPADFAFQLTREEIQGISQSVTSFPGGADIKFSKSVIAFTEQGVAMLSSVLRSPRAVQVNIEIMRTFVRLRQWLASNAELAKRLDELEKKYDRNFKVVFEAIRQLMAEDEKPRREIGFHTTRSASAKAARVNRKS